MSLTNQRNYDPFGRLGQDIRQPDPEIDNITDPFELSDSVGAQGKNNRRDVAKVETMLGRAGTLDLTKTDGPTGYWGMRTDEATRNFQKKTGESVDAQINRRGPTHRALVQTAQVSDTHDAAKRRKERWENRQPPAYDTGDAAKRRKERRGHRPTPGSSETQDNPFDYRDFNDAFSVEPKDVKPDPFVEKDKTPDKKSGPTSRGGGGGGGYYPNPKLPPWMRRGPQRWNK